MEATIPDALCLKIVTLISQSAVTQGCAAAAKSLQSCPTLCDPLGGRPPFSPVPGVIQVRTLEWVSIAFSDPGV